MRLYAVEVHVFIVKEFFSSRINSESEVKSSYSHYLVEVFKDRSAPNLNSENCADYYKVS